MRPLSHSLTLAGRLIEYHLVVTLFLISPLMGSFSVVRVMGRALTLLGLLELGGE
jgi:hypothetical protein